MVIESVADASLRWAVVLGVVAGGLLLWPWSPVRLGHIPMVRASAPNGGGAPATAGRRSIGASAGVLVGRAWPVVVAIVAIAGLGAASWALSVALLLVLLTVRRLVRRALAAHRDHGDLMAAAALLRAMVRELHAGATPAIAAQRAAAGVGVTRAVRAIVAVFGDATGAPTERVDRPSRRGAPDRRDTGRDAGPETGRDDASIALRAVTSQLRVVAHASAVHGIPLADLLAACRADLDDRLAVQQMRATEVAGPAVSGYVLAALPGLGLLLGTGMGADPWQVLFASALGGGLLICGVALCCAGLVWSDHIVRGGRDA